MRARLSRSRPRAGEGGSSAPPWRAVALAVLALFTLAAATCPPRAHGAEDESSDAYDDILDDFHRRMRSPTVSGGVAAVQLLDPANPRSLPAYLTVLEKRHWMIRGAAMEALAKIPAGPLRSELRLHLITHEHVWVREGIAFAMVLGAQVGDADALVGAMDDPDWRVRRTAARGLAEIISREGVERLVQALGSETDLRVRIWVHASLRAVSGTDFGRDVKLWQQWWEQHKDRPEWTKQGEEVKREDFAGVPLETITIGGPPLTDEERERRKKRPQLFVLAPFGFDHGWYRPYLDEAAEFIRITYVNLPTVAELTGQSGFGSSIPVYPVKKLARALDALRKDRGQERIVIMATGPGGWIAETYALKYPKQTAGLVIVNSWLDAESYANGLYRLKARGTSSERWVARSLTGSGEARRDESEGERIRRILLTHAFEDPRDSEAFRLWRGATQVHGFVTVPPIRFDRHTRIEVPTLFFFPDPGIAPTSGGNQDDLRRIRASFRKPSPTTAVMRDTKGMAHAETPDEFLRVLRAHLQRAGLLD